jgi:AcrR family transcriptional regulator
MPAYTRLDVDERRRQLLERGRELFTANAYDELTMAAIAREAGISKALLYHYFPSKQAYFAATLSEAAAEVAARVVPDPELAPAEQLSRALDAWLAWIDDNRTAYVKLLRSAGAVPEVRELIERVRTDTAALILERLGDTSPERRASVRGWLWFMDGVCLDWVEHDDLDRAAVHALLMRALAAVAPL